MRIFAARHAHTWGIGTVWAAVMLLLGVVMPRPGGWTIDDGVKRAAAEHGTGIWAETIPDGGVRAALRNPAAFAAFKPPFAYRGLEGLAPGFSPLTRAFFNAFAGHEIAFRIALALAVILLWVLMEQAGFPYAFLLLPLTFYGLVPWEHGLSWLLVWPAVWATVVRQKVKPGFFAIGGAMAALAVLLRPETLLLAAALGALMLVRRNFRGLLVYVGAGILTAGCVAVLHAATAHEPLWVQLSLNESGRPDLLSWFQRLPAAAWVLLIMMDRNVWISTLMLIVLLVAALLLDITERRGTRATLVTGWVLIVVWLAFYQYHLWHNPFPPLMAGWSNSLLATLPWVIVLARPPYRERHALWMAAAVMGAVILTTPAWQGVHWGPRVMLLAMPLLVVDLHQTGRARGALFAAMFAVTAVQTLSSAGLVYAQDQELADRCHTAAPLLGQVVVCPSTGYTADLAPLWEGREFFTVTNERELQQLLMEFRRIGLDTCWLHTTSRDSIYAHAFPNGKPAEAVSDTVFEGGTLFRRSWQIKALALHRADTTWAGMLQTEAGRLLQESHGERALDIQSQAVELTPNSAQVHHNLALIYSKLGETIEARAAVGRALEIDSMLTEARLLSADLSRRSGGTPAAGERLPDRDRARPPD